MADRAATWPADPGSSEHCVNRTITTWAPVARNRRIFPVLLVIGSAVTIAAAVAGNGNIGMAVAPLVGVALLGLLWAIPLLIPLLVFVFLGLGIDAADEGPWNSPFSQIGQILFHNINKTIPVDSLAFPLLAVVLFYLLIIHVHRRLSQSNIDGVVTGIANPMAWALAASFLVVMIECANGLRAGGDMKMAKIQVQSFVLTLMVGYLLSVSLRGIRDFRILGSVILVAAVSKSLIAIWVMHIIPTAMVDPAYATTHGDSMLFAGAAAIVIARFAERPVARNAWLAMGILPILGRAMIANNRRIAWVEVVASVAVVYVLGRRTRIRQLLVAAAVPLALAYVAVGWDSSSSVFAPVRSLRTVGDADIDSSTLFRDLENFNLLATLKIRPIIGTGFGQQFDEPVTTPDLPSFKEYRYMPHNSILGLWGFMGWLGFTGLFTALVAAVFWAARSYRFARLADERTAALAAICFVLIYLIQCWGDLGFSERNGVFLVGSALGVAAQLAISTGAWGSTRGEGVASRAA
jgi:hypothetical protein